MSAALQPGYKQTEVGVIPEDWDYRTLEELTDPARPIGYGIVQTGKSIFNGVKCVRVVDIVSGRVDPDQLITTTPEISNAYKRTLLRENDLIIALRGKIGAVAVISEELAGSNLTRGVALLSSSEVVHSGYLSQYLSSTVGRNTIEKNLNGSALQEIPIAALRKIPAAVPPLPEQSAIATALSDADALLGGLDRLIAKKLGLKVAAMQQLLTGQTRLPGFSGEWEVKRLGNVLRVCHGKSQLGVEAQGGLYPILASGGEIGRTNTFLYDKPSVLIGRKGTIDKPQFRNEPFWTVDTLFYTEISGANSAKFLFYKFNMIDWRSHNEASGVPSLNASAIEKIEIWLPEPDEQTAIATVLSDMDSELAALQARRDKTRDLKQAMMQELLTGRIRLV